MRYWICFLFLLVTSLVYAGQPRCSHYGHQHNNAGQRANINYSDSVDVTHYIISLDITDFGGRTISGNCEVDFTAKVDLNELKLDLLALAVDSVIVNGLQVLFSHNDTLLRVTLPQTLNSGQSLKVKVFYGGRPVIDDTGWGGFYFNGNYAFNLGVGFGADPHNYGRPWHPCVDNFVERATYEYYITTRAGDAAACGGLLIGQQPNTNGTITWHWEQNQSIPTYLASVAVADYAFVNTTFSGVNGAIPIQLAARATDTTKLKTAFINLDNNIEGFEARFGPYMWERVGFAIVPFTGGAMEHACNIAYPLASINGTPDENLMAHELSHHWFGNLVTCKTAEDMWLNEGWASFSAFVFQEWVYGRDKYLDELRATHHEVLRYTHIRDAGYRAVSGVPHEYTYGSTVYDKGALVAHALRGYMGDQAFFDCITSYLGMYQFNHATSNDLRDHMATCSGIDLNAFFTNWVFAEGFTDFVIDENTGTMNNGVYEGKLTIRQKLKAAPSYYTDVPVEVSFYDKDRSRVIKLVFMNGSCGDWNYTLPFEPLFIALDRDELLTDANTSYAITIGQTGTYDFKEALMEVKVNAISDSALVLVEHHFTAPNPMAPEPQGFHLSKERFWVVDGIWPTGFGAEATIDYNGSTSVTNGYYDNELITNTEDSLRLMYRPDGVSAWQVHPDYQLITQVSTTNARGQMVINDLQKGQYTLAIYDAARANDPEDVNAEACMVITSVEEQIAVNSFKIYPNPGSDTFYIELNGVPSEPLEFVLLDYAGRSLKNMTLAAGSKQLRFQVNDLPQGVYFIKLNNELNSTTKKLIIQ